MKQFTIYLAGSMDFSTKEYQTTWRNRATDYFAKYNVRTLNPCRRPHDSDLTKQEIFNLDMQDLHDSDLLLYDFRNDKIPQFGSPAEIMYFSYVLRRPVIGWYDKNNPPDSRGVFQDVLITRAFPSLDESIDHILAYYL